MIKKKIFFFLHCVLSCFDIQKVAFQGFCEILLLFDRCCTQLQGSRFGWPGAAPAWGWDLARKEGWICSRLPLLPPALLLLHFSCCDSGVRNVALELRLEGWLHVVVSTSASGKSEAPVFRRHIAFTEREW